MLSTLFFVLHGGANLLFVRTPVITANALSSLCIGISVDFTFYLLAVMLPFQYCNPEAVHHVRIPGRTHNCLFRQWSVSVTKSCSFLMLCWYPRLHPTWSPAAIAHYPPCRTCGTGGVSSTPCVLQLALQCVKLYTIKCKPWYFLISTYALCCYTDILPCFIASRLVTFLQC